ncbi:PucR family transcriptional regulator [Streptomyces sp. NPDC058691]|uniref:PucR family transcriptional regulator n=1 Tax=Streptomyces sp. NPDC058691 TaxID=3346601 RepID=UPI0036577295
MAAEYPGAVKRLSVVAENVGSHLSEVSCDIGENLIAEIPELRGDDTVVKILQASVADNVSTLLHIFENDIPLDNVEGPVAATEYARRLAQRDVSVSALVRAYRIGHWRFLQWCLDELDRQDADKDLHAATHRRMLRVSFGYIDRITEHVIEVYQFERDHWLLSRTAVRANRVRDILAERQVDPDRVESTLGYRLRQHHLGMVAWLPPSTGDGAGLARLDRMTHLIARELHCSARPLFVPRDESLAWAWLPLGPCADVPLDRLPQAIERCDPSIRVCLGAVGRGVEGFRFTLRQALRAQELAAVAVPPPRFTDYSRVAPIALMSTNIQDLRAWVQAVLGPLATDDENSARLRETVQIFLDTGGSYTATAGAQILHKNTVQYRIRKIEEALGHPVQKGHTDLEVALLAVQYLGSALLHPDIP